MPLQKQEGDKCESCTQYFSRRLKEGWKCIEFDYPIATLLSPDCVIKRVDLQNDVETLRPNAAGDLTEITYQYPASGAHWDKVDEATPDDNTTRVYIDQTASILTDLYHLPAHSGVGTINSVVIYVRAAAETNAIGKLRIMSKTHSTLYQTSEVSLTTSWTTYSTTHTNNPNTSSAWTWAEIDALQIGAKIKDGNEWYEVDVTQVYVEVNYNPIAPKTSSDTGSGVDEGIVVETFNILNKSDTGTGMDALVPGNPFAIQNKADIGSGADIRTGLLETTSRDSSDIGVGIDARAALSVAVNRGDNGTGNDSIGSRSLTGFADQGAGVDVRTALLGEFNKLDSGSGTEGAPKVTTIWQRTDFGAGVETSIKSEIASSRGFYYSKLGTDNLINPSDPNFNVTVEHNGIASFDFVIQNNAANRTIITDHLTEDYTIMREDGTVILVGSIDSDSIEYFAEGEGGAGKRIRLSGYANFIDLAYLIYKRMADADAEAVGSVQDEDNSTATFTDYTTAANNDTINDVLPTFGAVNDTLYVGKDETFFAIKTKYSTKGVQELPQFGASNYAGPTGAVITHNYNLSNYTAFITSTADAEATVGETHINSINPNSFTIHNSGHGLSGFRWLISDNPHDNGDSTFAGPGGQTVTHTKGDINYVPCIIPSANGSGAIGEWWITDIANTSFVARNSGSGLTAFKWAIPRFETGGKGASSFAGPNGVIIAHNLNISGEYIPLISPTENPNGHLGAVYVTDITANAFTVKNTGSAITTFSWIIADKGENTTVVIEYSKGSGVWTTLDCIDESYAFTEDAGTYLLYMPNKADDWAKDTVNGKNQYHIRSRITQGSYTIKPKLDRVWLSNADVCRVQFNAVSAKTILGYVLTGTGYSEDAMDQCPSTPITIRGEYDSLLRWIFGIGSALTWEDGNGDKQRYDVWIDTSNKVHFKQQRGTDKGDLSGNFRAVNNKMGYHGIGTRIFGAGDYDGINQKRAVVEDLTAQGTHKLREIVLEDSRITGYEALKEETQKSLTIHKAPLKEVSGDIDTTYWLDNSLSVGDKITINQPDWNLNDEELYIMRAIINPSNTHLDLGTSQMHLEHMRSSLQRQLDINNVWMHGSVSTYVVGPEEENFERENDITVHPVRMTIEVPSNARAINHVEISWTLSDFLSSVKGSENLPAHDHTIADSGNEGAHDHPIGPSVAAGAHDHPIGPSVAAGAHDHATSSDGLHAHVITSAGVHWHTISGTITWTENLAVAHVYATENAGGHSHTNPITSGPSGTTSVIQDIGYGSLCDSGNCVTGSDPCSVASPGHTHSQGNTGYEADHFHPSGFITGYYVTNIDSVSAWTSSQHDGHAHPESTEPAHDHGVTIEVAHAHTNPNSGTKPAHQHTNPNSGTKPAHRHTVPDTSSEPGGAVTLKYGMYNAASGDALELLINDEKVGDFVGSQTGINITGWVSTGHNSVELQPKVTDNVKGRASISAIATVFLENLK